MSKLLFNYIEEGNKILILKLSIVNIIIIIISKVIFRDKVDILMQFEITCKAKCRLLFSKCLLKSPEIYSDLSQTSMTGFVVKTVNG